MSMRTVAALGIVLGLAACTAAPIYNVQDQIVTTSSAGRAATAAEVRNAILAAGSTLGWQIRDVSPGKLEGTLVLRTHTAIVDIPYSAKSYSIVYKSSVNLTEANGTIHKNYNGWVQNLDRGIRSALATL